MGKRDLTPIHPGEILLEGFLNPMDISQYRLAMDIKVDPGRQESFHVTREQERNPDVRMEC